MLESIRSSARSLWVKIAFGVIILVFVFWGVGNYNDRDYSNVVAVVNGQPILAVEFARAYQAAEEAIMRNNPGVTREQLAQDQLGRQVLRDMITSTLLAQEAERAGVFVSPGELLNQVSRVEAFQNDNGKFDPDVYQRVLAAQRLTPAQYEKNVSDAMIEGKMFQLVTAPAWVDEEEARNRFKYLGEQRQVSYLFVPAKDFVADIQVTEDQAREFYQQHPEAFATPAKVNIQYISVEPADLVDKDAISDEVAKQWYQDNQERYAVEEGVNAAHILVPVAQDADEALQDAAREQIALIQQELAAGKPFADLADQYNPQNAADKGGELGWIGRGMTVPEFEEVAFSATPGIVSDVVRTPFGLHLVLVHEHRQAGVRPFAEVADEVRTAVATEEGMDKLSEVLDDLIEDNIMQKPMTDSAEKYKLAVRTSGLLDKNELMREVGVASEGADALLAIPAGAPLDTPLEAGNGYVVARVTEAVPAGTETFDVARGQIEKELALDGALEKAMQEATTVLEKAAGDPAFAPDGLKGEVQVMRGAPIEGMYPDPALNEAIFAQKPVAWLPKATMAATTDGTGALIVRVDAIQPADEEAWERVRDQLAESVRQDRQEGMYALFLEHLGDHAKIEITNQSIIDQLGR